MKFHKDKIKNKKAYQDWYGWLVFIGICYLTIGVFTMLTSHGDEHTIKKALIPTSLGFAIVLLYLINRMRPR